MTSFYPACNILGVNVSAVSMNSAVNYINEHIKELSGNYVCVSNVHTTVMSYEDPNYLKIQNSAALVLPDGGPLSLIGKKRGFINMERVTGPDLMTEIFKISTECGYRHFFFGSTEKTLTMLAYRLKYKYPGIQIVGTYSPTREELLNDEIEIINQINQAKADFIWVGLGAPKQERWMGIHQGRVNGLMIGVGAGFDYHAGNIKRAPMWMQKNNMEWLYRLWQEPKRLFARYLKFNIKFLYLMCLKKCIKNKI